MGVILFVVLFLLYLLLSFYIAYQFSEVASEKGYHDNKYLWLCFLLGLPGWLLVCALPDRGIVIPTNSDELPDL